VSDELPAWRCELLTELGLWADTVRAIPEWERPGPWR
jgi:hypothetical protein